MAGAEGLELSTSGFGDRRSSQLSYAPIPYQHGKRLPHFAAPNVKCLGGLETLYGGRMQG